eukprot:2187269-Amphidinium_carterae.1
MQARQMMSVWSSSRFVASAVLQLPSFAPENLAVAVLQEGMSDMAWCASTMLFALALSAPEKGYSHQVFMATSC